ncbi:MAG TPA: hypothetical protein VHV10_05060 [Ktedonobacteraceae bacterium]|jgi:hypothetical protein|nr:hypothetical protein [Ktedonobacteraceae bacterium]
MKLGKLPTKHDHRTLQLANYLRPEALPPIPAQKDWSPKVSTWNMLANDRLGCCTISSSAHMEEAWTANASTEIIPSDSDIIKAYSDVSGYNPQTGANDNGAYCLDVLNYWRHTGIAGRKIDSYVALEPTNHTHIKAAVYLFGGVYIGLALPISAESQAIWAVPSGGPHGRGAPGSWGGHCCNVVAWDSHYLTVVTWGALKKMTWSFWGQYCDESYGVLSLDFFANGVAPNAINWAALQQDLHAL